ncbi:related to CUE domain protein [Cephalotrichum gorgonifer]|uniref:Related to CUE domain protein n=1 Tax=Cephalotrichum gorgonifer TaxID=2041049 RepID=A0AAE8MU11_9PEZI|nr:related to CUE domain protein [Cephalotrichum gorgonifer]
MDTFLTKKRKLPTEGASHPEEDNETTDVKLAILSSLHPDIDQSTLLDVLIAHDGSVAEVSAVLKSGIPQRKSSGPSGYQSSLRHFAQKGGEHDVSSPSKKKLISKKGTTMYLYDPVDVAEHTPCTIIHNFLPPEDANGLLREMLEESKTFEKITFKLFENVVASPHTSGFYVESYEEIRAQKTAYHYNGARLTDVRRITPHLQKIKPTIQAAVNKEIEARIATHYPNARKLKYQSPKPWVPNAAFVNCYDGPKESVGWHSDQLTYLGPRAVIGSLSLGVAREFRVRRILPKDGAGSDGAADSTGDAEGQISIHLPHNSLLVMHAEMQEEWKHSISAAQAIEPHPIAGNKRINVTYRHYRSSLHPSLTPRCKCEIPCVLRVARRKRDSFGKYFWMCHSGNLPGKDACSFFEWAEFDDDGDPIWRKKTGRPSKAS